MCDDEYVICFTNLQNFIPGKPCINWRQSEGIILKFGADYLNPFHAYDEGNLSWLVVVCSFYFYLCIFFFVAMVLVKLFVFIRLQQKQRLPPCQW